MEKKLKIIALIPARGGSKSIPKKNIVNLGGYPLIAYTIAAAKLSKYIDRVIVTTDDEEIASIAKEYGAEVPFLRPKEISQDNSLDIDFFVHALDFLEKKQGYVPDLIIHLRPTTPLRDYKIMDKAIGEIINDKKATSLRSAHVSEQTGYKLFRMNNGFCNFFGESDHEIIEYYNMPRQALQKTYNPNGYVDIIIPKTLKETGLLHGKFIKAFITEKIADIDVYSDFDFAKTIVKKEEFRELIKKLEGIKNGKLLGDNLLYK